MSLWGTWKSIKCHDLLKGYLQMEGDLQKAKAMLLYDGLFSKGSTVEFSMRGSVTPFVLTLENALGNSAKYLKPFQDIYQFPRTLTKSECYIFISNDSTLQLSTDLLKTNEKDQVTQMSGKYKMIYPNFTDYGTFHIFWRDD